MWSVEVNERTETGGGRWRHHMLCQLEPTLDDLNILRARHGAVQATERDKQGDVLQVVLMRRASAYRLRYTVRENAEAV